MKWMPSASSCLTLLRVAGCSPHARVHGWRREHRLVGREQHGRREIVGVPLRHAGQQVRGGRCHDDEVGFARQADVADLALVVEIEQIREHAVVGQSAELTAASRIPGPRFVRTARTPMPRSLEAPDEIETFVGGNAAADDEKNAFHENLSRAKT